jgi:hypothetical protein
MGELNTASLTIDFGEVGNDYRRHPFRIELNALPLEELICASRQVHRVHELLLIDRPGDVWEYVCVSPQGLPPYVTQSIARARQALQASNHADAHPWPEGRIPFTQFDRLFFWSGDDTDPASEAWLRYRESQPMRAFAKQVLSMAQSAQATLEAEDVLLQHVASRIRSGEHVYCYLDRQDAKKRSREGAPKAARHTPGFYEKLSELLRDEDLKSAAYRGPGDHCAMRMMATEQRRRAKLSGQKPSDALHLKAAVSDRINNEAWESEIWFSHGGSCQGDLYIQGVRWDPGRLKGLIEAHHIETGKYILSVQDEGELAGYGRQFGDGWVLYGDSP